MIIVYNTTTNGIIYTVEQSTEFMPPVETGHDILISTNESIRAHLHRIYHGNGLPEVKPKINTVLTSDKLTVSLGADPIVTLSVTVSNLQPGEVVSEIKLMVEDVLLVLNLADNAGSQQIEFTSTGTYRIFCSDPIYRMPPIEIEVVG